MSRPKLIAALKMVAQTKNRNPPNWGLKETRPSPLLSLRDQYGNRALHHACRSVHPQLVPTSLAQTVLNHSPDLPNVFAIVSPTPVSPGRCRRATARARMGHSDRGKAGTVGVMGVATCVHATGPAVVRATRWVQTCSQVAGDGEPPKRLRAQVIGLCAVLGAWMQLTIGSLI